MNTDGSIVVDIDRVVQDIGEVAEVILVHLLVPVQDLPVLEVEVVEAAADEAAEEVRDRANHVCK